MAWSSICASPEVLWCARSGSGQTVQPDVFVCGEVTGPMSAEEAARHGACVGQTVAASLIRAGRSVTETPSVAG